MPKKNFQNINPAMAFISDASKEQDEPNTHDTQKVQNVQDILNTHDIQNVQNIPNALFTQEELNVQDASNTHIVPVAHITQGKKGRKLPRINMAFSPENLEYLQIISRIEGKSITEYVNILIRTDSSTRASEIKKAKSVLKI